MKLINDSFRFIKLPIELVEVELEDPKPIKCQPSWRCSHVFPKSTEFRNNSCTTFWSFHRRGLPTRYDLTNIIIYKLNKNKEIKTKGIRMNNNYIGLLTLLAYKLLTLCHFYFWTFFLTSFSQLFFFSQLVPNTKLNEDFF